MNILVSVNAKYISPLLTMLSSLKKENSSEKINIFLMYTNLNSQELKHIEDYIIKIGFSTFNAIYITNKVMKEWPLCSEQFSIEVYNRVLCHFYLPSDLDRILWLDADIIVMNNINNLYNIDLEGKSIAVVPDVNHLSDFIKELKVKNSLPINHNYFNSGVILFDLNKIRKDYKFERINSVIENNQSNFIYPDQDLLNILYIDDFMELSNEYNYQVFNLESNNYDLNWIDRNVFILHYTGMKPWDFKYLNKVKVFYWQIRNQFFENNYYYRYLILNCIYVVFRTLKLLGKKLMRED